VAPAWLDANQDRWSLQPGSGQVPLSRFQPMARRLSPAAHG